MKTKTTDEWLKELSELGIPCGPVNTVGQVARDAQITARDMIVEVGHRRLGKVKVVNTPIRLSRTRCKVERACPDLGEHTEEVFRSLLDMSPYEVVTLREEGVV